MKMVGRVIFLIVLGLVAGMLVFSSGCLHGSSFYREPTCPEPPSKKISVSASWKGLQWLKTKQNSDGSWGHNPTNQVALTSFAILAFLSEGHTPASKEFGECVEGGMRRILEYADLIQSNRPNLSIENRHIPSEQILNWALAESSGWCKLPVLMQSSSNLSKRFIDSGKQSASVWQALALKASYVSRIDIGLSKEAVNMLIMGNGNRTQTNDLLSAAIQLTKMELSGSRFVQGEKYTELLEYVGKNAHVNWANHNEDYPMFTWFLCSISLFQNGKTMHGWYRDNFLEFAKYQRRSSTTENIGYWEVPVTKQGKGRQERDMWGVPDADIYATCLVLLSAPHDNHSPRFPPPQQFQPAEQATDDIEIKILPSNEHTGK